MTSRLRNLALAVVVAVFTTSCATSSFDPSTGQIHASAPSASLQSEGSRQFEAYKRKKKISTNAAYNAQVRRVAARLKPIINMPNAHWEFVVFEDPQPNAFALPGGKVGVNTGLFQITQNDAGLAAVLGHEISHVTLNHAQSRISNATTIALGTLILDGVLASQGVDSNTRILAATGTAAAGTVGVMLPNSRNAELEADKLGTIYMARAGYDPHEAIAMWQRFSTWRQKKGQGQSSEFLRTHPLDQNRIAALQAFMPVAMKEYRR